jgi:fatty acid desaturase
MQKSTIAGTPGEYRTLASQMRDAGLFERHPARYAMRMGLTFAAFAAGWTALFAVGDSWRSIGVATFLAFIFTQLGFIGHDAGHHQIFESRGANRVVGLVAANALIGLSFGWWVPKHNAHHAHPNVVGQDPDIGAGAAALSFTADIARSRHGAGRLLARYQAWLFFPLLALEGAGLHISGVDAILRRRDRPAAIEGLLLAIHAAFYLSVVVLVLSPLRALAFVAVHQGLFGLYLGCSFAPNHKGMPVLEVDSDLGFVRCQIITARNVAGGRITTFMLGGLNYQIEHHLFPTMPRCNLPRAQGIVRSFCIERRIGYREDSLVGSYRQALQYLNLVGAV